MTQKLALVTITCGDYYTEMSKITHPLFSKYAEKIGADFLVLNEKTDGLPHYLKLKLNKLLKKYDRILYMDTDILIREDATNIFDEVPEDCIGMFEEGQFVNRATGMLDFLRANNVDTKDWNNKYYNTGVMVVSKQHANVFINPIIEHNHFFEQSYLNLLFSVFKVKVHNLHYKWNRMSLMDKLTGEERFDSYFLHYAGCSFILGEQGLLGIMKDDLAQWKLDAPSYHYKKNIAVIVEGGLGDQICAEPTIRYMKEKLYKGDNLIVVTDFPDVFKGANLPVHKKGEAIKESKAYYEMHTLRSPDHVSWEYMSHPLTHTVDFAALQALRMTLPLDYKQINLKINLDAYLSLFEKFPDFADYILVHPGRGWDSKTFPKDVWESYINALIDLGYTVAMIGKRISDEQGVVELNVNSPNCIDLIDKLTYEELVVLIGTCKVLLTNDSSPVHIAGAFDNYIGVISTCKRPEHTLPYRKGSHFYKAESLEEFKLYDMYNAQPSQVYGATIDKCDDDTIRKCLPSPEKIVKFVSNCYGEHDG